MPLATALLPYSVLYLVARCVTGITCCGIHMCSFSLGIVFGWYEFLLEIIWLVFAYRQMAQRALPLNWSGRFALLSSRCRMESPKESSLAPCASDIQLQRGDDVPGSSCICLTGMDSVSPRPGFPSNHLPSTLLVRCHFQSFIMTPFYLNYSIVVVFFLHKKMQTRLDKTMLRL